jgi:hypothetical protein
MASAGLPSLNIPPNARRPARHISPARHTRNSLRSSGRARAAFALEAWQAALFSARYRGLQPSWQAWLSRFYGGGAPTPSGSGPRCCGANAPVTGRGRAPLACSRVEPAIEALSRRRVGYRCRDGTDRPCHHRRRPALPRPQTRPVTTHDHELLNDFAGALPGPGGFAGHGSKLSRILGPLTNHAQPMLVRLPEGSRGTAGCGPGNETCQRPARSSARRAMPGFVSWLSHACEARAGSVC